LILAFFLTYPKVDEIGYEIFSHMSSIINKSLVKMLLLLLFVFICAAILFLVIAYLALGGGRAAAAKADAPPKGTAY
jgi:hypothetical protein